MDFIKTLEKESISWKKTDKNWCISHNSSPFKWMVIQILKDNGIEDNGQGVLRVKDGILTIDGYVERTVIPTYETYVYNIPKEIKKVGDLDLEIDRSGLVGFKTRPQEEFDVFIRRQLQRDIENAIKKDIENDPNTLYLVQAFSGKCSNGVFSVSYRIVRRVQIPIHIKLEV